MPIAIQVVYVAMMAFTCKNGGKHSTERVWTVSCLVHVSPSVKPSHKNLIKEKWECFDLKDKRTKWISREE